MVHDTAWPRHTIDDSSQGADGVRLADVNGDSLLDVATGWEEGGVVRVYVHPGKNKVKQKWPSITVGNVRSPEDALPIDLDGDGQVDVVSSCEGTNRTVYVHWAPARQRYHEPALWTTQPIPATAGKQMWMYALPMDMDGQAGVDLLVASRGSDAAVGWLQSPTDPRDLPRWQYHKLYDAGWIMSLSPCDLDRDGDVDVVVSDRKGDHSGVHWLQNHGPLTADDRPRWQKHDLGGPGEEVMFVDVADLDGDRRLDVVAAVKPNTILVLTQPDNPERTWPARKIQLPAADVGTAKAARVGDVDRDGRPGIIFSCEGATSPKIGVFWLSSRDSLTNGDWELHNISGADGVKYDHLELLDLDQDGDLDVLTCEERENLGVIWYENPAR
jgi:hypothetical protein